MRLKKWVMITSKEFITYLVHLIIPNGKMKRWRSKINLFFQMMRAITKKGGCHSMTSRKDDQVLCIEVMCSLPIGDQMVKVSRYSTDQVFMRAHSMKELVKVSVVESQQEEKFTKENSTTIR